MVYLGFDDTDSRRRLCTTWLATEFIREFEDFDLLGYPRLVRLNPNVPWKTRGNGALYLRFGEGRGTPLVVGGLAGRPIYSYAKGQAAEVTDSFEVHVRQVLERGCAFEDPTTHPGYAILHRRPTASLYWAAVRRIVTVDEALEAGAGCGRIEGFKEGRGRIGALAAISWRPRDRTYEAIAYRDPRRWGTPREISEGSVVELDRRFPSTFNNYDADNRHVVIAPNSPCPVLCGIRGDDPSVLADALGSVESEPVDRWLLFETNQGTDDHLIPAMASPLIPRSSFVFEANVAAPPRVLPGGHVVIAVVRPGGEHVDCVVYEPAKQFRRIARALQTGDRVRICGAVRDRPHAVNVEKLAVYELVPGRRALATGWYEPPTSSRRHLAKPLKRFSSKELASVSV